MKSRNRDTMMGEMRKNDGEEKRNYDCENAKQRKYDTENSI
jgi:hypothetical protein